MGASGFEQDENAGHKTCTVYLLEVQAEQWQVRF